MWTNFDKILSAYFPTHFSKHSKFCAIWFDICRMTAIQSIHYQKKKHPVPKHSIHLCVDNVPWNLSCAGACNELPWDGLSPGPLRRRGCFCMRQDWILLGLSVSDHQLPTGKKTIPILCWCPPTLWDLNKITIQFRTTQYSRLSAFRERGKTRDAYFTGLLLAGSVFSKHVIGQPSMA